MQIPSAYVSLMHPVPVLLCCLCIQTLETSCAVFACLHCCCCDLLAANYAEGLTILHVVPNSQRVFCCESHFNTLQNDTIVQCRFIDCKICYFYLFLDPTILALVLGCAVLVPLPMRMQLCIEAALLAHRLVPEVPEESSMHHVSDCHAPIRGYC